MQVTCNNCGIKFNKPKAWVKRVKNNYCSHKCFGEYWSKNYCRESTKIKLNCDECGKVIYKYRAWAKRLKHNFCSRECNAIWKSKHLRGSNNARYNKKVVSCDYCGKKIIKKNYLVKEDKKCFCNQNCLGKWLSKNAIGKNASNWRGGVNPINDTIRKSIKYKKWRISVFKRDKYTCQNCGDNKGGKLNAHHIKSFSKYSKLRFDISNGITLCEDCHKLTSNYLHKAKLILNT